MEVRRFIKGDEIGICEVIKKDILAEMTKDYPQEEVERLIREQNEDMIIRRAEKFHCYTFLDENKIVGVGMIGPYWDSKTESSFFTIFRDPEYKGKGLGRKIIETLEQDEYYLNADRVEIPASLTAVEFYKHFGWGFKHLGNILDEEGIYRMEKFPKISDDNSNPNQYNMRPYIDNDYHNFKEFIYQTKKDAYKEYVEKIWGPWNEEKQRQLFENFISSVDKDTWIIELNGKKIGFYNGFTENDGTYHIGNICIIKEYQEKGIGTQVLKDILELHKDKEIHIQYFKGNSVVSLYERLGFIPNGETETHYQMIKPKKPKKTL